MSSPHSPKQNHLLAALPAEDYERLSQDLELVPLPLGWAAHESGGKLGYVYFPTTSIVSLLYAMDNGASAEIALTGNDGLVGIALSMGGEGTPTRAVVQTAGYGYRLKTAILQREFREGGHLRFLALRYAQALAMQMAQTAICNRRHPVEQQLCRWLLLSLDRLPTNELKITKELIANMFGVNAAGIDEAALKLQAEKLIQYTRGHIIVLDRSKMEDHVCGCYESINQESNRLLPDSVAVS
ncbi:MAG: Crp/Fnr family transcriptional regulator [Herminiimonas sp.]|nr:Crp/Fnr family transcriptional regulator [Herminiimonas sp.]